MGDQYHRFRWFQYFHAQPHTYQDEYPISHSDSHAYSNPGATFTPTRTPTTGPSPTPDEHIERIDLIFADGFESGSLAGWTSNSNDAGDLSASAASALVGSQGMQAVIDDRQHNLCD
jgi:hypothetical protein